MNLTETHILVKALSATQSPVTITDARLPDNPIVYCNEAFVRLTGYSKREIINKNCRFLQGPETSKTEVAKLRRGIDTKRDVNVLVRNYTKQGRAFWNDLQVSPVYNDKGELTHHIGLQIDVTERIERERALAATRQLEHEKRLLAEEKERLLRINEIKDDFIAVASHQLRTPATAVKQYLGMVVDGMLGDVTKAQAKALETAYKNNNRQLKIIDDLLKIARIDTGKVVLERTTTDMVELTSSVLEDFKYRLIDAKQKLVTKFPAGPVQLDIDRDLMHTVLENLLDNAVKYSREPGTITVGVRQLKRSVRIDIEDHGIGMSETDMEKIYLKFVRSNSEAARNIGGTGLGLYWVKKVLDKHDATISVSSKVGKGTTFRITFPNPT